MDRLTRTDANDALAGFCFPEGDEGFQAALQDYHHNGGSSARVARAALKAIGEE
jgi:hypothetical protein